MTLKTNIQNWSTRITLTQHYRDGLGGGYDTTNTSAQQTATADTRDGVGQPKWRSIIKSGQNAATTLNGTRTRRLSYAPFSGTVGFDPVPLLDPASYSENVIGMSATANTNPVHVTGTSLVSAENSALISALGRVRQQRTQFQGLTFLGELKETLTMLKHPFQGVRKYVDQYFTDLRKMQKGRSGNQSRSKRRESFLTTAAGAWLEVSFGIKPLLSDTKDAAEAIARYQNDSRRSVVTGYGEDVKVQDSIADEYYGNYTIVSVKERRRTTQSVRYKVYMDYSRSADFQSTDRLLQLVGFTPENFVPTIWELIPWSFLIDYFSNVGNVLEAGCTSQNEVKFTVRTQRLETIRVITCTPGLSNPAHLSRFWEKNPADIGECITSRATIFRSPAGALDTPKFELSLPGRPVQWGNMLALWQSSEYSLTKGFRSRG